jgi:hypothetical protein
MDWKARIYSPIPSPSEREKRLEIEPITNGNDIISHSYIKEAP